jgi:phosphate transport system protein
MMIIIGALATYTEDTIAPTGWRRGATTSASLLSALTAAAVAAQGRTESDDPMSMEFAIAIMARQAPVAKDLRLVVSALRISASLERMGDKAEHLAQLARYRFPEKVVPKTIRPIFKEMGSLDIELAKMLVVLLKTEDVAVAEKIRDEDDKVDALHLSVFETVLSDSWSQGTETTVDANIAYRDMERFADHAVSIAKKMLYLATGEWNQPKH